MLCGASLPRLQARGYNECSCRKRSISSFKRSFWRFNALKAATYDMLQKMNADPALAAKLNADPTLRLRPGGLPIKVADEVIGAIGVGGTPTRNGVAGGEGDAACAKAGLDKIKDRLK
jgi:uncharacterized protein GlcG (DUF336 family)